jgi:two-component sensor histidine kinase
LAFSRPDPAAYTGQPIANSLGLLRAQACNGAGARPFEGEKMRAILAELGSRADVVARLHRQLAARPLEEAIDLADYLRDISGAVVTALSASREIELEFICEGPCYLPTERVLPIGLIVMELVANAVRYAHPTGVPGEITVGCSEGTDGTVTVEVSDDGVGFPEGLDPMKADTLGLRLVRAVAEQLGARVQFAQDLLGLSCLLRVPGEQRA